MKRITKKEHWINRLREVQELTEGQRRFEERMTTIQTLIGLGMKAATEEIQSEFTELTGLRYGRGKPLGGYGTNRGSVYLGDQKVALTVPRVRAGRAGAEVRLKSYDRLQSPVSQSF